MHNTVKYSTKPNPEQAAMRDIRRWLGITKFLELDTEFSKFTAATMPIERFEMFLGVAGIQGYPVTVWHKRLYGDKA